MKRALVLYATREGHTQQVAEYIAQKLRERNLEADIRNVAGLPEEFPLDNYDGAFLAASVHLQRHEPEMVRFARRNREALEKLRAVFLSISLSEAGAEMESSTPEKRAAAAADVDAMIQAFLAETGWRPSRIQPVAGALPYSRYNFFIRFLMKRIARSAGGGTDTSQDYVYTDWGALDRLVEEFAQAGPLPSP